MIDLKYVDLLADDQTSDTPDLHEIRFNPDEAFVIPFTRTAAEIAVHWFDGDGHRGFYVCDGSGCVFCKAGYTATPRYLIPFYSLDTESVGVAMVPTALDPKSFYPQLKSHWLASEKAGQPLLLTVSKLSDGKSFKVSGKPVPENVSDGAEAIAAFDKAIQANKVDLTSILRRIPASELQELPTIAKRLKAKGAA